MASRQTAKEYALDQLQQGKISTGQANVMMVQIEGVRVVKGKIPLDVRRALNDAVKAGELGHLKRDGLKPEVYFHKNGRANAIAERNKIAYSSIEALKKIAC